MFGGIGGIGFNSIANFWYRLSGFSLEASGRRGAWKIRKWSQGSGSRAKYLAAKKRLPWATWKWE